MKIYNGYKRLNENYTNIVDEYEHTMGNGYFVVRKSEQEAIFDLFFRKVPNNGGYAIMAGIDKVIEYIESISFDERELNYFRNNNYSEEYINYLKNKRFTGDIYAIPDGTPVFPNEPILTVKAPLNEAQMIETALLCLINGAMEHATGTRRLVEATPKKVKILEMGSRRADGIEAAIDSAIYGIMCGCIGTSNIQAAHMLNKKSVGTMAHSWVESFQTELEAFITYAKIYPNNCILLVDTYDTLRSGIPNAIKTFEYMKENNMPLGNIGIRIDSGNLAELSKQARKLFKEAGFPQAKICLSSSLTAEKIERLVQAKAEFDMLGIGDSISKPEGRMGCVYKLVALEENGKYRPKIKVSNDKVKIINPDYKKLYRAYDKDTGYAIADVMTRQGERVKTDDLLIINPASSSNNNIINNFELVELQKPIFLKGKLVYNDPDISTKANYCNEQMATIYSEVKRIVKPQEYPVAATTDYIKMKNELIQKVKTLSMSK